MSPLNVKMSEKARQARQTGSQAGIQITEPTMFRHSRPAEKQSDVLIWLSNNQ